MKYKKLNSIIEIEDLSEFNIKQILECGQIFRFNIKDNCGYGNSGIYFVYSANVPI